MTTTQQLPITSAEVAVFSTGPQWSITFTWPQIAVGTIEVLAGDGTYSPTVVTQALADQITGLPANAYLPPAAGPVTIAYYDDVPDWSITIDAPPPPTSDTDVWAGPDSVTWTAPDLGPVRGLESQLMTGAAALLAAANVGTYRDDGTAYGSDETAIVLGELPPTPDRVIGLTTYPVSDDPALSDSVVGLQVVTRTTGSVLDLADLTGAVFDQLHGLRDTRLSSGLWVVQLLRRSGTPLGLDENRRWRHSQNFYATIHAPSAHRT